MTTKVVTKWWSQVVTGGQDKVKAMRYVYLQVFWVNESIFEVFSSLGAVMTTQAVIKWWSQVVIEGQTRLKPCNMSIYRFFGSRNLFLRFLDLYEWSRPLRWSYNGGHTWSQGVKTMLNPCNMYIYRFFGSRNPFLRYLDLLIIHNPKSLCSQITIIL